MAKIEDILMVKGPDVTVAPPTTTALEAARLMTEANVGSVIIRIDGEVLGIFTERDLLQRVVAEGKDPASVSLADVMSAPVVTCRLDDDVAQYAERLGKAHMRHLAVVEDGVLVGLVGLRDMLAAQLRSNKQELECLRQPGMAR